MARLIAALAALVLGWLSILTPSSAAVTLTSSPVATYGYDDHHSPAQFVDTNSERGPPAAHDRATTVYDARALLLSPDSAAAGARSSPSRSGAASWGRSASVRGDVVAANTADDLVDVWRTVGPDEAADIAATGAYRVQPGGEGKYFFPTQAQAENLANMYNKAGWPGPQTITRGQVPQSVLGRAEGVNAGTEGPGWFIRSPDVPSICNVQCVGVID